MEDGHIGETKAATMEEDTSRVSALHAADAPLLIYGHVFLARIDRCKQKISAAAVTYDTLKSGHTHIHAVQQ
jgi:predicted phosphodiesterase